MCLHSEETFFSPRSLAEYPRGGQTHDQNQPSEKAQGGHCTWWNLMVGLVGSLSSRSLLFCFALVLFGGDFVCLFLVWESKMEKSDLLRL